MKCKYCQAEMPDDGVFCPYCGKSNAFDAAAQVEQILEEEGEATVIVHPEELQEEENVVQEAAASPEIKKMKRMALMSGCFAVLAILGTVLFFAIRGGFDFGSLFAWAKPRQDTLLGNASYSVSDKKAWNKREEVVATMGDLELTNGQLQIYYWMEVMSFIDNYSYYLSYLGMDYKQPLDEQKSMGEDGSTWQQYFLQSALDTWRSNQSMANLAKANGFQLPEEEQKYLDELPATLEASAKKEKYDSADAMLQSEMGPGCNVEDYMAYMETYYYSYLYFAQLYEELKPTEAEIEKYFTDNADSFKESNITKESGNYYTVQHLLVPLEGGTKGEDGKTIYTDAEWEACRQKAQALLDGWKAAEMTKETFAQLIEKNTTNKTNLLYGGTISNFKKDDIKAQVGEAFENWSMDEVRKAGDVELIKSDLGYHLVYFLESEEIWYAEAEKGLRNEMGTKIVKDTLEQNPIEVNYKKIVLGVVELG